MKPIKMIMNNNNNNNNNNVRFTQHFLRDVLNQECVYHSTT